MRGVTIAVVAVAVVVVAAVLYVRSGGPEPPITAPAPVAKAPAKSPLSVTTKHDDAGDRSARVEERLGQLREDFERRQAGPEAQKRAMPTVADNAQRKAMEADAADDDGDDEDPEEMEQLKHTLLTDPDPDERIGAVLMLTGEEGPRSLSMLLEAMGDPDPEVRLAVVEALGDRSEDLSPETLTPALKDPDPEVRFEAVSILGDIEDNPQALEMVRAAQNDPDPDTAALAQGILDELDQQPGQAKPQPGQPQNAQQHK